MKKALSSFFTALLLVAICSSAHSAAFPVDRVNAVFGREAQELGGPVFKYSWPRTDLKVEVDRVPIAPGLALGSWAAFMPMGSKTWLMGDLVLLQSEVGPVMARLEAGGIEVTGLHNHLLNESPRVVYVHYMGEGDPLIVARALRTALARSGTPLQPRPPTQQAEGVPAWVSELESALGRKGKLKGKVLSVSMPRDAQVRMHGEVLPPAMGIETALNFQQADRKLISAGDFVLVGSEVNPVIKALQQHGITVTAIHNHMLDDSPHLFFLHYWALGAPTELGAALKAALAETRVRP